MLRLRFKRIIEFILVVSVCYSSGAWSVTAQDKAHLLGRLSFGLAAHPNLELDGKNRKQAVALLLESVNTTIDAPPPGWLAYTFGQIPANLPLSKDALRKFQNARNKLRREQRQDLKRWWFHQIATGRSPVAERLVLFWHNFFTTEINMLPNPAMSWQQQLVLRQHALGNYRHLLRAMNQDPALLWYLDNHLNKKKKPNENYARELLELYTLGEGNYSEGDIKELARTMTGAGVDSASWTYLFRRGQHDNAEKTFLGTRGNLHPDQVIDIILRQKQASEYLVRRLWTEFVSPLPDQKIVAEMAAVFRRHDYELKPLLQALFEHPAFWASENRMTLVKSPVELLVGTHLSAGKPVDDYKKAVIALAEMGQDLFNPPDVGGWPAGKEWINSVRLARRHQYQIGVAEPSPSQLKLDYQLK